MLSRSDLSPPVDRPRSVANLRNFLRPIIIAWPAAGLVIGLAAQFSGSGHWASPIWAAAKIPVLLALVAEIAISLRRGDVGLDIVAALSMLAALVFAEYLAAVVVALMYAGGQYLEDFAERRASREMTALLARVPHTARAVAVLVVATPCPLILAVPVAIVSGVSQAAKPGILITGAL